MDWILALFPQIFGAFATSDHIGGAVKALAPTALVPSVTTFFFVDQKSVKRILVIVPVATSVLIDISSWVSISFHDRVLIRYYTVLRDNLSYSVIAPFTVFVRSVLSSFYCLKFKCCTNLATVSPY